MNINSGYVVANSRNLTINGIPLIVTPPTDVPSKFINVYPIMLIKYDVAPANFIFYTDCNIYTDLVPSGVSLSNAIRFAYGNATINNLTVQFNEFQGLGLLDATATNMTATVIDKKAVYRYTVNNPLKYNALELHIGNGYGGLR